ncbi:AraC family transcriptional regulator [Mucilaginibacter yixingensis]|uniref:AraC family transcriptional regulator n=1 Tax=Mucilaginibacter yixingensis TaxID=1295612 RepID=A0A2T5JGN5_9SPHI|nr:AraC family transcriptional regulator [Mucilaginibacter yixingensis]PTR01554.1 AraC family transcriptional regulator [Mucilaginibacter yixingensis]
MKPQLLKVSTGPAQSFSVRQDVHPINNKWHYHPEVELLYIKRGSGTEFTGDSIRHFRAGDVILIGSNLPHYWRFDEPYYNDSDSKHEANVVVVHFNENFWGAPFLQLPENVGIKNLLTESKRGVLINGATKKLIAELLDQMLAVEGSARIVLLMQALNIIASSPKLSILSSISFKPVPQSIDNDRIDAIHQYSMVNFKKKIQLEEIAAIAHVSPNSFCRYFKSHTGKTYSQFLIEIKVGQACRLLIENKLSIKQLCYESGFNNFASFHKNFKQITGKSPLVYQKEFMTPRHDTSDVKRRQYRMVS